MGRFSEVLLLVSLTLLSSLLVIGDLRPTFSFKPVKRSAVIRGLLVSRQGLCNPGFLECEATGCCPIAWNCCIDGNCCQPNTYCALADNGIIGCCDVGQICTGPVGGPTSINGPPPGPTTAPVPAPVPVPTTTTIPAPVPTTTPVVNTTPTFAPTTPVVQTTVNGNTVVGNTPTTPATAATTSRPSSSSGPPLSSSAAGQAELYRPLLVVLVGVLVVAMY